MRILPTMHTNRNFVNNANNVRVNANKKADNARSNVRAHEYTGVASVDLAYASMFDNEIARDLRLMGLI